MNVSRNFLLTGTAFLLIGLLLGMYMGGSGDYSLALSHAHINLVGFVMSVIFALAYKAYPEMAVGRLPVIHFWLHVLGAVVLNIMLILLLSKRISEAAMVPIAPISELLIVIGVAIFGWNALQRAR